MTLIAKLTPNGVPFLISDVLITADRDAEIAPANEISLPTLGDIPRVIGASSAWYMATTIQKSVLVSDKLAITWAGDYQPARRIVLAATQYFKNHDHIASSDMRKFLATQNYDDQMAVQLVGLCVSGTTVDSFALNQGLRVTHESWGDCVIAGSGANLLSSFLEDFSSSFPASSTAKDVPNVVLQAICRVCFLNQSFLFGEARGGGGIRNRFGGILESCFFADGKLQKLSDVLMFFWEVNILGRGNYTLRSQFVFSKMTYWNDFLVVLKKSTAARDEALEAYLIDNMHREYGTPSEYMGFRVPDPESLFHSHLFVVSRDGTLVRLMPLFQYGETDKFVTFETRGTITDIRFTEKFMETVTGLLDSIEEQTR